ncbi:MAG: NUDIX domain-containing protein [Ilumatobacteraceae bacterium]
MEHPSAAHPENSPDEMVEQVDRFGAVTGLVSRREMRERHLRHRSVFVAVVSNDGQLLVHRRADTKDVWPGWWDVAIGGVCAPGETWHDAAVREVNEEIGVERAAVELVARGAYVDDEVSLVAAVFMCRTDGPFRFADGEVTEAHWVRPDDMNDWLGAKNFLPDSVALVLPRVLPRLG